MVRNIAILSGSSHPGFVDSICEMLGIAPAARLLTKFSCGETRCEIRDSVRGKDVYIIQTFGVGGEGVPPNSGSGGSDGNSSGGYTVNDYFVELCIMISACKTGSAKRVTAVLPLFPYSRQPDLPFSKVGAPLVGGNPRLAEAGREGGSGEEKAGSNNNGDAGGEGTKATPGWASPAKPQYYTTHDYENPALMMALQARSGHKQFMAQSGSLIADLLTCAGADRILTCDLHENAYQGFFDIPVDNLRARSILQRYIVHHIPNWRDAVIVSPDAGGAKRATAVADSLGLPLALIHKERRPPQITQPPGPTMMLVGNVAGRTCILIDDLVDTAFTITRAAKLLKREGRATRVIALLTHGVLSGDAIARINATDALDRIIVTNTVPQERNRRACSKLEVLDVSGAFAEAIRRVHHGESMSSLFQYD